VDIAGVNHAGATLPWRSNEPTTGIVRFATGETFAGATEIESASLALAHQVSLIGLLPGLTYYKQVIVRVRQNRSQESRTAI
jgi:hypothetical protein